MKKVLTLVFILVSSLLPQNLGFAATEDEQWPIPNEFGLGHHLVLKMMKTAVRDGSTITTPSYRFVKLPHKLIALKVYLPLQNQAT